MKTGRLLTVLLLVFLLLSIGPAALAEEGGEALALRFVCDETVAQVTVYAPAGLPVAVGADGIHHLTPGTYYYSAEAEGYESTGLQPFTIPADAAGDQELRISLTPAADDTQPDAVPGQVPLNPENPDALEENENPEDDGKLRIRPVDGSLTLTVERETKAESAVPPALQKLLEGKEKPLLTADGKPVEKKLYLKTPDAEELYLDRLAVEKELGYYTTDWTVLNLTDEEGARKKLVPADSWYDVTVSGPATEKYHGYEPVFALLTLHWDEEGDIVDRDVQILETTHTPTWSSWSFSTDTLSTLVIAIPTGQPVEMEEEAAQNRPAFAASSTVDGVTVTVSAPAGVFPADAVLWVERVPLTEEIDAAVEAERDRTRTVAAKYTFDIRVINPETMEEYQPEEGQTVSVSFALAEVADENLQTQVYHVTEAESTGELSAEALEVSEEGLTATAETEGFSYYQVEFTYEKLEYVLPGDTSVPLSEILTELGLSGDVTEVVCSKPELFSADWNEREKQWIVTAHQAFNTQEWMKVTIDGMIYEITVTDDSDITPVAYVDASGVAQTPVTEYTAVESVTTAWADGWYVADTDTAIGSRVTVSGNVNLILCDGATLKAGQGITVAGGNSLTIWAQSLEDGKGMLYAGTTDGTGVSLGGNSAGIGGDASNTATGAITVNGGTIYAFGNYGAGIGGGSNGSAGTIAVAGGEIHAKGGYWAAGIGSGPWTGGSGSVNITGGKVYAIGGTSGAGIGAGSNGNIDSIAISGEATVVEAQPQFSMWGGQYAAGIGGGEAGTVGTITITGGSITAAGSNAGPGIGAGGKGSCGTVTITGGSILSSSKTVTSGGEAGPGIGCGFNATVSSVEIGGSATVTAIAGYSGYLADGSVIPAIGPGVRGSFGGLTLYDTARVWAGENEASKTAILAWPDGRADACMENVYAEIQPCGHPETDSLWITEETHNLTCRYCHAKQNETKHEFQGSGDVQVCDVCGAVKVTYITAEGAAAGPKVCLQTTGDMTGDSALGGWYAVAKSTTLDTRIEITGDVNLILCDGCTLTAAGGIYVPQGASLTVWAQSTGGGMGTLTTGTPSGEQDGIGGNSGDGGTITVNGGAVTATGSGSGAGIGGSVTVNGGTIYAAGNYGAGIGGVVAIRGGSVTATSVDGTVTLGWSDATRAGMSVTAGSYSGTVKLEEDFCEKKTDGSPGRVFAATGEAAADDALKAAIEGVTLVPCDAYDITLSVTPAGTENAVTASVDGVPAVKAVEGSSVVLEITADEAKGYLLNSITVVDADGDNVALSGSGGFRTFNMPAGAVTVTASFTGLPLTGTVTVSGMPTYGETLTAAYTPGNNTGELSFQWLRGDTVIDGATGESYTLTGDDVGRTISCRVSSSIQTGTVASDPTEAVAKAVGTADATKGETPSAVDGMIFTGQPQELVTAPTELPEGYTGIQYSTDSGKTWGDDVPTGAEAGEYTVSVKYIGDQNHEDFSGEDLTVQIRAVVTLNPNGGAFDDPAQGEQHVIYGETAVKPEDPKRENFDFAGWYQDADCRIPFDFSTPITYSHVTFYAKWISNVYVVTSVTGTTQDDSHVWKKGSKEDAVITVELKEGEDVSFDHFTGEKHGVWFSGEKLTEGADYTADRGSTIITLKAAFLQKQSTGGHDVIIRFDNGEAQTLVTVKSPAGDGGDSTRAPKTGDESRTAFWAAMMALSGMGLVIVGTEEKRSRKPRYVGKH